MKVDLNGKVTLPDENELTAGRLIWRSKPVMPALWPAIRRGIAGRCPVCGETPLFVGYLRVTPFCRHCHALLGSVPADDAPPYFTILLVGHLVVPLLALMEIYVKPPMWVEAAIFLPLTAALALGLLRPIKGATVAWLLHHGHETDPLPQWDGLP
jgi:uncharacterized protein (DUF983 family)